MLKAGSYGKGRLFPSERGTPQGGVVSPLLSNILLTPFDQEMRRKGYQLTRYADDWVVTCESAAEAQAAIAAARRILEQLGVQLHPQKTRIVHVRRGFEFLGYKIKRGKGQLRLPPDKIRSGMQPGALYAYPSREINPPFHGSGARAYQAARTTADQGADRGTESCLTGMGSPLQAGPRPRALPPTRWLDRAADSLASVQTLAEPRVETPSGSQAIRRVWACQPSLVNTFTCLSQA